MWVRVSVWDNKRKKWKSKYLSVSVQVSGSLITTFFCFTIESFLLQDTTLLSQKSRAKCLFKKS